MFNENELSLANRAIMRRFVLQIAGEKDIGRIKTQVDIHVRLHSSRLTNDRLRHQSKVICKNDDLNVLSADCYFVTRFREEKDRNSMVFCLNKAE